MRRGARVHYYEENDGLAFPDEPYVAIKRDCSAPPVLLDAVHLNGRNVDGETNRRARSRDVYSRRFEFAAETATV